MKTIIRENNWLPRNYMHMDFGWGNGYVIIPKGHKLHGKDYNEDVFDSININGGLTFSELVNKEDFENWEGVEESDIGGWMVGFDTAHARDTLAYWTKERVQEEADNLKTQLENL